LGQARFAGYLDDYATLIHSLVTLYEAEFDEQWIDESVRLADTMLEQFHDPIAGGFYLTANDHEELITRAKDFQDSATPSGNAMAALALLRLGKLCGRVDYLQAAEGTLRLGIGLARRSALAASQLLNALDFYLGPTPEIVVIGQRDDKPTADLMQDLRKRFLPNRTLAFRDPAHDRHASPHLDPLFEAKVAAEAGPAVYVCENFACTSPVFGADEARQTWDRLSEAAAG
jgi:uncharacterized protein YyaL (SSP411 family)